MAIIVTMDEPEIAAKIAELRIAATPRPPGRWPTRARATSVRRRAVVPLVITPPHSMNMGIARISSLSSDTNMSSMIQLRCPRPQTVCEKAMAASRMINSG
ncbi:MAG: hypothetical protein R3D60_07010 [Paracoccaceae bacterium]